jgi:DNA gyrase subunit A
MRGVITEELETIKQAYGDRRRTVIADSTATTVATSDLLMPSEDTWVTLTVEGKLGRSFEFEPPKVTTQVTEPPRFALESNSNEILYLFTADGRCATVPVHQLPQVHEPPEGQPFNNLCALASMDEIVAVLSLPSMLETGFLFLATQNADVKRLRIEDIPGLSANAFTVMNVAEGDRLGWVLLTNGQAEVMLITAQGQAIRFDENDVRSTGLPAGGMRGIKLGEGQDRVVGAMRVVDGQFVWTVTDDGIGKISPVSEFPSQGRAGSGVIAMRLPKNSTEVTAATIGKADHEIIVLNNRNKPLQMRLNRAPQVVRGRPGGDIVMSVHGKERVNAVVNFQPRVDIAEFAPSETTTEGA